MDSRRAAGKAAWYGFSQATSGGKRSPVCEVKSSRVSGGCSLAEARISPTLTRSFRERR